MANTTIASSGPSWIDQLKNPALLAFTLGIAILIPLTSILNVPGFQPVVATFDVGTFDTPQSAPHTLASLVGPVTSKPLVNQ